MKVAVPKPKFQQDLDRQRAAYRRRRLQGAKRRAQRLSADVLPQRVLVPLLTVLILAGTATATLMTYGLPSLPGDPQLESELRRLSANARLQPLQAGFEHGTEEVKLGKALFFDKILSGNKDISCAGCHAPELAMTDHIPLSIGTGGHKLGPARTLGEGRAFIPRHAPDLFNRGAPGWTTMMWDARIVEEADGRVRIPDVPEPIRGLDGALAGQVAHTLLNPAEMRGMPGDMTRLKEVNELATLETPAEMWEGIARRVRNIPGYTRQFERAYPGINTNDIGIVEIANAIAAYERSELTFTESPWDRWLAGDTSALSDRQKKGALLFYSRAQCSTCHSGVLMTDQLLHNLAVPQLRSAGLELDRGGGAYDADPTAQYAFRTPPLRQVADTAPYMHSGAYATLPDAIRHHLDPAGMLADYSPHALRDDVEPLARLGPAVEGALLATVDPALATIGPLSSGEIGLLVGFLEALSDPAASELKTDAPVLPSPSALPVGYDD